MNKKTSDLSICEMRLHLFNRVEYLVNQTRISDADAVAKEWIIDGMNPDYDPTYEFAVDCFHKKTRSQHKKKYDELDF